MLPPQSRRVVELGADAREYEPGDEEGIRELFGICFGRDRPIEEWAWRYREGPAEKIWIHVLDAGGRIVGHISHMVFRGFVAGHPALLRLPGDSMVHPEWRRRGSHAALMGQSDLSLYDAVIMFPTEYSVRQNLRAGRQRFVTRVQQWLCWTAFRPWSLATARGSRRGGGAGPIGVEPLSDLGPEVDALAQASATFAPCIRTRDAAYLRWRWLEQPGAGWKLHAARDGRGNLRGVSAFGIDHRTDPPGLGRVVDLLALDGAATRALLARAARELAADGCRRVAFDYQDPRPWARRACYSAGFVPRGRRLLASGAATSDRARPWADDFANWYITRGDSDLC